MGLRQILSKYEDRLLSLLLPRRRGVLIDGDEVVYTEVVAGRKGWRLRHLRTGSTGDLSRIVAEEGLRNKGAMIGVGNVPLALVPPPAPGEEEIAWAQRTTPRELRGLPGFAGVSELGEIARAAAWWREGALENALEGLNDWCDGASPAAFLIAEAIRPECALGPWCALNVLDGQARLWLMHGGIVHHGCRLEGGLGDLPLLRRELADALASFQGDRCSWGDASFALLRPMDRLEELLAELGLRAIEFPWRSDFSQLPLDARWGATVAVWDDSRVVWENWAGPIHRERGAVRAALRLSLVICAAILCLSALALAGRLWVTQIDAQVASKEHSLAADKSWLTSLDSLEKLGSARSGQTRASSLAVVANCSSPQLRFLSWKSGDSPLRHSLEIVALDESTWFAMKTCLEASPLVGSVLTRSIEFRRNAAPMDRVRLFVEVKER